MYNIYVPMEIMINKHMSQINRQTDRWTDKKIDVWTENRHVDREIKKVKQIRD